MKHLLIVVVTLLCMVGTAIAGAEDITIQNFAVKYLDPGKAWVRSSFKVDFYNAGVTGNISFTIQGIDSEGFERRIAILDGKCLNAGNHSLTKSDLIPADDVNYITEWRVKSIYKYDYCN